MSPFEWTLFALAATFMAACLWAWEQLDRIDRAHWYQVTGKTPTQHQPESWTRESRRQHLLERAMIEAHQKKGAPQGHPAAHADPQNQQHTKKNTLRGGQPR